MDLIVAADDARFMTAMLQYFPLPFDVGPRKAKELLFDAHEIGADEAHELGFVNRVVPRGDLEAETMALAGLSGLLERWIQARDSRKMLEDVYVKMSIGALNALRDAP